MNGQATVQAFVDSFHHSDMSGEAYVVTGTTNYLAQRSEPATDASNEIAKLHNGDTVYLMSKEGEFWYVSSAVTGYRGYVNSKYLTKAGSASDVNVQKGSGTCPYRVVGVKNYLALRTEMSNDPANEIGKIYNGELVEVLAGRSTDGYYYVYAPTLNKNGYVNCNYLEYAGDSTGNKSTSSSGQKNGKTYTVTGTTNYLGLRSAPEYNENNVIGKLYNGQTVEYIFTCDSGDYWYVYAPSLGMEGYVNYKYLVK